MIHSLTVTAAKSASSTIDWGHIGQATLKVIFVGVLLGSGLPALFALGLRFWNEGNDFVHPDGTVSKGKPAAKAVALVAFAVILLAIAYGLALMFSTTIKHYTGYHIPLPGVK